MRPKKVILCVDADEQDLSVLTFMLATNGYRVLAAPSSRQAEQLFADHMIDLVLAATVLGETSGDLLIRKLKNIAVHVPMVLMGELSLGQIHVADAFISKRCTSVELLELIQLRSARKRGPRKGNYVLNSRGEQ